MRSNPVVRHRSWQRRLAGPFVGVLMVALLAASVPLLSLQGTPSTLAAGPTATFTPAADAYVSASSPGTNYSTGSTLRVDGSPIVRSYLRFNVQGLAGSVTKATLRVYANSSGGAGYSVRGVADNTWGETTITDANAPAMATTVTGSSGAVTGGTWTNVDVTTLVTGNGTWSLGLVTAGSTAISLASRESGANAPQLVIETGTSAATPTAVSATPTATPTGAPATATSVPPTATTAPATATTVPATPTVVPATPTATTVVTPGQVTFTPTADAYVQQSYPSSNYGTGSSLRVDGLPVVRSYLRFNVQGLAGSVTKATLRVYANSSGSAGYSVRGLADNTWGETTITDASAPAMSTTVTGSSGAITGGTWTNVDVTTLVSGNGTWSLGLVTSGSTAISLASRESGPNAPQLVVETGASAATPTSVPATPTGVPPTPTRTPTSNPTPTPQSGSSNDPVVAAAGDMVCGAASTGAACKQMETSNLLVQMNPAAVLPLGDVQYEEGALRDFLDYYEPSWGRVKSVTRPSVGNHEYLTAGAAGYFDYFNGVGNFSGIAGDRDKGYYSFDVGSWHLIALNSNCSKAGGCGAGSAQEKWLRADLAAHPNTCTLAYFHHPRFSSGQHGNNTAMQPFFQALYDYGAELALVGHDHHYERFAPQDPLGRADPARGIRQFIVGTGGRNHTGIFTIAPNSEVRDATSFGVLQLTLHATGYDWRYVPIAGQTFTDSGSGSCR